MTLKKEFRCVRCNKLLGKFDGLANVQIKCSRRDCKTVNELQDGVAILIESQEDHAQ